MQNESNQSEKEEKEQEKIPCVPAEEDNKICAICNEEFEQFWDNDSEEWMFKGVIKVGSALYHSNCYSVNASRSSDSIPGLTLGEASETNHGSLKRDATNSFDSEQVCIYYYYYYFYISPLFDDSHHHYHPPPSHQTLQREQQATTKRMKKDEGDSHAS